MKHQTHFDSSKKIRFIEILVSFIKWCDSHGIFKLLADFVLKLIIWRLTK